MSGTSGLGPRESLAAWLVGARVRGVPAGGARVTGAWPRAGPPQPRAGAEESGAGSDGACCRLGAVRHIPFGGSFAWRVASPGGVRHEQGPSSRIAAPAPSAAPPTLE